MATPNPPAVELRPVTEENFRDVMRLCVADDQRDFVASNAYSVAQTTILPWARANAVHVDGRPMGFVLWGKDPRDGAWWIVRVMVDRAHQRKGIGRAAMREVLAAIGRERTGEDVFLSVVCSNVVARRLYESLSFRATGLMDDGEEVFRWEPSPA